MSLPSKPITRKEQYLAKAAGQDVEIPAKPITREEEYLDAIAKKPGGGGGTSDYEQLDNLPQINGVTLSGDKSASDLSLASANDLAGKQDAITAGLYIQMQNNEISVKRDISKADTAVNYVCNTVGIGSFTIKKYVNGEQVGSTIQYEYTTIVGAQNIDDVFTVSYNATTANWVITNTVASNEHPAGYEKTMFRSLSAEYSQTFVAVLDADKKLIIQSELDAAVNAIKDGQSIDSFADVETALANKQDTLTFDDTPTDGSNNPVKSNGIYDALATKANTDMVAADFNAESSYTAGNYCIYEGKFYRFKNSHSGAWAAADVDEIKIAGELSSIKSGLNGLLKYKVFGNEASDTTNHLYSTDVPASQYVCVGGCTPYNPNFCIQVSNIQVTSTGFIRYRLYDVVSNQVVSDNNGYTVYLVFVDTTMLSELVITP